LHTITVRPYVIRFGAHAADDEERGAASAGNQGMKKCGGEKVGE
jgi:hypothetical protein